MTYDDIIIGSGFAGSLLARLLALSGRTVLLLERDHHPRFALGESSTPLASLALERLAARFDQPDLHALSTWGRWRRGRPELRRGLKRGFTFYRHTAGRHFDDTTPEEPRLLVAASPNDEVADVHWLRADVDYHLVKEAVAAGVRFRDGETVVGIEVGDRGVVVRTESARYHGDGVIDASGPARVLTRLLELGDRSAEMSIQSALLAGHFEALPSFPALAREHGARFPAGPYDDEQAAVHHLLDRAWAYVLPFDHGVASCGLVLRRPDAQTRAVARDDPRRAWRQLLSPYPTLATQLADAVAVEPLRFIDTINYRSATAAGDRWLLLPHAFAFVDPMFSTGIAWSLAGVERAVDVRTGAAGDAARYGALLELEVDQIERLERAADLAAAATFDLFVAVTMLYFVTVSFAEAHQRLVAGDQGTAWGGFLGTGDRWAEDLFRETADRLEALGPSPEPTATKALEADIREALADRDLLGIDRADRRRLVPVDLDLLVDRHAQLGLTRAAIAAALPRLRGDLG